MKILVTGASGLIGSALVDSLQKEHHHVFTLVRNSEEIHPGQIPWDPEKSLINTALLEGFDAVIHLAGENIAAGRWTAERKKRIFESRTKSTRFLAQTLANLKRPPKVFICASAIGYYGSREHELLTEESRKGSGFLADVCVNWEEAAQPAKEAGIRVVNLRTGIVLSSKGGALAKMLPAFKWGVGGVLGDGKQMMSWVALDDLVRMIAFALDFPLHGPVNAVSPHPVTNRVFTKTLGRVLNRPTIFAVPAFAIRLLLGEMGEELLLSSARVAPKRLEESGFSFLYPDLEAALRHAIEQQ